MRRLEDSFDLLEKGKISLATFEKLVLAEKEAIKCQEPAEDLDNADPMTEADDEELIRSLETVDQCLSWIESYRQKD
ncbi:MAG: hypothetical protein KDE32_05845 [Novosphingobium sp.]|nr:hypothetical protein [Novosphingobium sp.]